LPKQIGTKLTKASFKELTRQIFSVQDCSLWSTSNQVKRTSKSLHLPYKKSRLTFVISRVNQPYFSINELISPTIDTD
jgi:hypothetical protein